MIEKKWSHFSKRKDTIRHTRREYLYYIVINPCTIIICSWITVEVFVFIFEVKYHCNNYKLYESQALSGDLEFLAVDFWHEQLPHFCTGLSLSRFHQYYLTNRHDLELFLSP